MTMLILAICARMCQINLYWGLGTGEAGEQGSRGAGEQRSRGAGEQESRGAEELALLYERLRQRLISATLNHQRSVTEEKLQ